MADQAHEWTDEEIERLERRFRRQYNQASREMRKRLDDMMESYDKANAEWKQRVKSGDATQEDYDGWLKDQATDRAFVQSMAQTLAQDANRTNQLAMDTVNDAIPSVFAENANYAAFEVEHGIGYETHAFDLYDQSTVRRLIRDQPDLLPPLPNPRMDNGRDLRWNRQKFAGVITQSVLQGESIPRAADRIGRVMRMNEAAATRAARTALTGAENAGRVDSYRRAQNIGIELEQEWLATHDERTRITHRLLDGEHVPVGERFVPDGYGDKYSIGFPGDPTALGEMVYNCRCTLVAWLPSIAEEDNRSWAKLPDGMTYDEWKHGKKVEKKRKEAAGVVDGKDILSTWKRRESEFDFEIEDVINAQGFDGKPRIVDADEFDKAVKAANGGNGFIAQRTYSAPDQETLDEYRKMLYEGKWYVDCSTGGSQYGQGMYCAADYMGKLSDGIKEEMQHYISLNESRGAEHAYVETMTLDPSAKIIRYADIDAEFARAEADSFLGVVKKANPRLTDREAAAVVRECGGTRSGSTFKLAKSWEREDPDGYDAFIEAQGKAWDKYKDAIEEVRLATASLDDGSKAAAMGYDAINAEGHGASGSYTVILNRTKLIIREP